jgi:hydroxyacylglutathione hydrolase
MPQRTADTLRPGETHVLDVRRTGEWERFHLAGATSIPLARLAESTRELDRNVEWTVVCASGFRSSIAASVLERAGLRARNVAGGMDAYRRAGLPVEAAASA